MPPIGRLLLAPIALAAAASFTPGADIPSSPYGLRLPPGFEVTEFADNTLVPDAVGLTFDPQGRVVVAGRGYVRILGADRAIDIAPAPKAAAHGLLWEGDSLYCVVDGGLRRYRVGPDGQAAGPSELLYKLKTGGEHDAHALRRGPDGWLYWLCGNGAGIGAKEAASPLSPVRSPVAGGVLRLSPDFQQVEVVADGFRNPYGFDFNGDGELFTFDSDNERCVALPWYEPTRLYHVIPGGHYGWQSPQRCETWRMPPYFADVVAPIATLGRGSPTGVVCYRHRQFPAKYRGGLFLADWTFGRIYFTPLERHGSTYATKPELFLEAVGDNGFAPTGLAVHPTTGDLWVSIGGRGTRGAVYRIRYTDGVKAATGFVTPPLPGRTLEWRDGDKVGLLERQRSPDKLARRQALDDVWRHRTQFRPEELMDAIRANWESPDRGRRQAAARLFAAVPGQTGDTLSFPTAVPRRRLTAGFGLVERGADREYPALQVRAVFENVGATAADRLDAVRLLQLVFGGQGASAAKGTVFEGYSARQPPAYPPQFAGLINLLREAFPTGDADLDREISRTLAMFGDDSPATFAKVMRHLDRDRWPVEDVHDLIVLARLTAPRPPSAARDVAATLLDLDRKVAAAGLNRDRNWFLRLAEIHAELARRDPGLNAAIVGYADFARPGNVVFTRAPGFDKKKAAELFLERAGRDPDYPWTPELVKLMGHLPPAKLRQLPANLGDRTDLADALLPILARDPLPADRSKFIDGLNSPQLEQVRLCLGALEKLPAGDSDDELVPLVRLLRTLPAGKAEAAVRERVGRSLAARTGQELGSDRDAWTAWLTKEHPALAAKLGGPDGVDVAGWERRLAAVAWDQGDAERGRAVFAKASCAACHSGSQAVGPDLAGVAGRFSRADLLTAILQPSKDVSPRYRTVQIATTDGKVYQGLVVYEAVDGLILQTGPAATVRLGGNQIESRGFSDRSLMPVGLMDKLTDGEIADLLAYLKALKK